MQKAQAMAQAMYGGGAGGAAGAGGMDELTRLRMENAALKGRAGA